MLDRVKQNFKLTIFIFRILAILACLVMSGRTATAQQVNQAWGFTAQNRASIAALMQQVENKSETAATVTSGGYTNLVCGNGSGSTSADGNSTCIILNNASGAIETGQNSQGAQSAANTATNTDATLSNALAALSK